MPYRRYPRYIPVAERRGKAQRKLKELRKNGKEMSPVQLAGGPVSRTFWGKAWCDNLERYSDYGSRLPRGRSYLVHNQVIDLQIDSGKIEAMVVGSRIYQVSIEVQPLSRAKWRKIKAECGRQVNSLVSLLQGTLPESVMEVVTRPNSGLFPSSKAISLSCTCLDFASMCKHVAATLYGVGVRLDEDPRHLFNLRGVDPQELVQAAAQGPLAQQKAVNAPTLESEELSSVFGIDLDLSGPEHLSLALPLLEDKPKARARIEQADLLELARENQEDFHFLDELLCMALIGTLLGARNIQSMRSDSLEREEWLEQWLELPAGFPSLEEWEQTFSLFHPDLLRADLLEWLSPLFEALEEPSPPKGRSKSSRRRKIVSESLLSGLAVWFSTRGVALGKGPIRTTFPRFFQLIRILDLKDTLVEFPSRQVSQFELESLLRRGGHYFMEVEKSHLLYFAPIRKLSEKALSNEFDEELVDCFITREGPGEEGRQLVFCTIELKEKPSWASELASLRTVGCVEIETQTAGGTSLEYHYFLTSLPNNASFLAQFVSENWKDECPFAHELKLFWRETWESRLAKSSKSNQKACVAHLKAIALEQLRKDLTVAGGVRARRKKAREDLQYLQRLLLL